MPELIMNELISQDNRYIKEVKYRLSDGENPNHLFLDIINRDTDNVNSLVWFLKKVFSIFERTFLIYIPLCNNS